MAASFTDDIFTCIFLNENISISLKISPKFVPKVPIDYDPAFVQIMTWHRPGDNPDSKVHGANMGPIWDRQDPGGPHVGPMNFAIWEAIILTDAG